MLKKEIIKAGFKNRTASILTNNGINTIGDLVNLDINEFRRIKGVGVLLFHEIVSVMNSVGFLLTRKGWQLNDKMNISYDDTDNLYMHLKNVSSRNVLTEKENVYSIFIIRLSDDTIHEVWKYLKSDNGEISCWSNTWYGRHVYGKDFVFV